MIDKIFGFLKNQDIVQSCSMPAWIVFSGFRLLSGCDRFMNETPKSFKKSRDFSLPSVVPWIQAGFFRLYQLRFNRDIR